MVVSKYGSSTPAETQAGHKLKWRFDQDMLIRTCWSGHADQDMLGSYIYCDFWLESTMFQFEMFDILDSFLLFSSIGPVWKPWFWNMNESIQFNIGTLWD